MKGAKLCGFCSAHLCKLLLWFARKDYKSILLLLCALVQVASMIERRASCPSSAFCSAHLCKLLLCILYKVLGREGFCSAHLCKLLQINTYSTTPPRELLLCALVQVASSLRFKRENVSTGFCSAHLCKLLLTYPMMICRFEVFCSAHLCKLLRHGAAAPDLPAVLLLCALVQVASFGLQFLCLGKMLLLCALVQVASTLPRLIENLVFPFCSAHLCKLLRQNCTVLCVRQ